MSVSWEGTRLGLPSLNASAAGCVIRAFVVRTLRILGFPFWILPALSPQTYLGSQSPDDTKMSTSLAQENIKMEDSKRKRRRSRNKNRLAGANGHLPSSKPLVSPRGAVRWKGR